MYNCIKQKDANDMNSSWFWRLVLEPTIRRPLRSASPHSWLDVLEDRKLPDIRSLTSTTQEVSINHHPQKEEQERLWLFQDIESSAHLPNQQETNTFTFVLMVWKKVIYNEIKIVIKKQILKIKVEIR